TAAAEKALTTYRHETLQYGVRPGLPDLREWIAGAMNMDGANVTPGEIFVTNGAKQGIELVCRLLLDEGDSIVVTAPTYFTSIPIFKSFEGTSEPSLKALDRDKNVLHLGTFSKLLAPGIRIGWVAGSPDLLARMIQLKADGGSSPLAQRIIVEWCKAGNLAAHTANVQRTYRLHRDRMVAALRRDLPEVSMLVPEGGYYLWL